ncbi:acyl-CoA dehydrogenase family protein [Virgibacillus halophilus]|uniref:Acyl-CoA dehydrogenase family protein n=1 Tax=Tigheibacillus halophilus TaxID=361280 RepID=A0ABU5C4L7_9BACI|nr:acyl-CoA dehydrogenase family protein [Virgibacillus halophilus]
MDFQLTEEQEMLRKMIRDFAKKEVEPSAAARDENERFDRGIFDKLAELGLTGIPWPEKFGGIGSDFVSYVIAVEELSRVCASTGVTLSAHVSLASWPIYKYGSEEQKKIFLYRLATGEALGAYALSEAGAGSDVASMKTTAKRDGDHYVINGSKVWITNGGAADVYIVFAKTDPPAGHKGISAFIVEKGMEGFTFGKKKRNWAFVLPRQRNSFLKIAGSQCRTYLGQKGEGFKIAMTTLDGGRNGIAAQAVGIAQGALDAAVVYAKEREQFGRPISHHQGISFKLADMATAVEASRLLTYQAAWLESEGEPYGKASAMSKLFASDAAMRVTTEAVQVFGGVRLYEGLPRGKIYA